MPLSGPDEQVAASEMFMPVSKTNIPHTPFFGIARTDVPLPSSGCGNPRIPVSSARSLPEQGQNHNIPRTLYPHAVDHGRWYFFNRLAYHPISVDETAHLSNSHNRLPVSTFGYSVQDRDAVYKQPERQGHYANYTEESF